MRHLARSGLLAAAAALATAAPGAADSEPQRPVYVGVRVCAECHAAAATGNQLSQWLLSRHARAYASLSLPEALPMAELSGIPGDPHESPICLGCHATGSAAEPWERGPDLLPADGVQCELCHGPGSEYMDATVMADRTAAMAAGLRLPDRQQCLKCHYVKGSHVAVHHRPQVDLDHAWRCTAHPRPAAAARPEPVTPAPAAVEPHPGPRFVGVTACAACHDRAAMGRQGSAWRLSGHALAWARLATPAAAEMARAAGVSGDPQRAAACLRCHSTAGSQAPGRLTATAAASEGVSCEGCHGPGSDYLSEAVMRDPVAAQRAGLAAVDAATCLACHESAHGRSFELSAALARIAHPLGGRAGAAVASLRHAERYKTPRNLTARPDGAELWVACEESDSVVVVDARQQTKVAEIAVGGQPNDVAFSPDGRRAYVSNRLDDSVSVVDVAARTVLGTIAVGDEPHGLVTSRDGRLLYVANTAGNDISVVDTEGLTELRRLPASRSPWSLSRSPDGARILVTNTLSSFVPFRSPSVSELTVVDAELGRVHDRVRVPETNLLQGVAWHPAGDLALFTLNRTKNLVPMTRILQGWTITNGLGVLWADGRVDQLLLDEPNLYFADTADVAISPDGRWAFATSQGTNRLAVVDVDRLRAFLAAASERERRELIPNHLGTAAEIVVAHLATEDAPRGVEVAPDGRTVYVANMLADSLTVVDVASLQVTGRVDLGGPTTITEIRRGQQLFHNADITFQRQFSCSSCHPDGHVDGLTYDIEADGLGVNPVDNRTLRGIYDTDPFKWEGTNPSLARQCGARLAAFFTRVDPFSPDELRAVNDYTVTIPRPPNRYRRPGADLSPAQSRGKAVFERTRAKDGREIPADNRCIACHFPPYYTDRSKRDVGSKHPSDTKAGVFDVPHLNNIYDSAPYLHNGMAETLEEIWTRFNPYDTHGVTNDMTKDELNDLVEYLKTL